MLLDLAFTAGFIFLSLVFVVIGQKEGFDFGSIILFLLFLFIGILPLFLFLNYLLFSFNKKIVIDEETGIINAENYFNFRNEKIENIESVEIYDLIDSRLLPFDFCYAKYFLKNNSFFIVTSFMTNSFFVPNGMKPQIVETIFPKLNKTNKQLEIESEKDVYLEKYKEFSEKELEEVINPKNGYRSNAVKAANDIIERRKNGV